MLTATNISFHQAEDMESLPPDTVLIAISDTFQDIFPLKIDRNSDKVLSVRFDDVTRSGDYGAGYRHTIDGLTTLQILDFIKRNKDKNFIVNCGVGISRSAAICMFLHIRYGHKLKDGFWTRGRSRPNQLVLGALFAYEYGHPGT